MEWKRQTIHMLAGFLIVLLCFVPYWGILCISLFGILFNLFFLPRLIPSIMRNITGDRRGVVFYPVAVTSLVILFPNNLEIVAGAWAILSFGDGMATLIGRLGKPVPLRWNPKKTVQGAISCFVFGALGAIGFMRLVEPEIVVEWEKWAGAAVLAAAVAAWVESLPLPVNDNLTVPASAALTLWLAQWVDIDLLNENIPGVWVLSSILVNGVLASILTTFRIVHGSATWAGLVLGTLIMVCGGWKGYLFLLIFFVLGTLATHHGYQIKLNRGVAQEDRGQRGARHVVANCAVPAVFAILISATPYGHWLMIALVASFATALMDTVSSEIGQVYGRYPVLPTTGETVPIGTEGAISMEGTLAGLAAAIALALVAWAVGAIPAVAMPVVVIAAFVATGAESVIGAWTHPQFTWKNEILNFGNTLVGGAVALFIVCQTEIGW